MKMLDCLGTDVEIMYCIFRGSHFEWRANIGRGKDEDNWR